MKWKICTIAFVSLLACCFPQNMIGCGPDQDDNDYFTTFFSSDISRTTDYRPYYFVQHGFFPEQPTPESAEELLAAEWAQYCGNNVSRQDVLQFVFDGNEKEISNLYEHIKNKKRLALSVSFLKNGMTRHFLQTKDLESLAYILYAKRLQPFVTGSYDDWEPVKRDSTAMAAFIQQGEKAYHASRNDFFKLKYGYQVVRLAHYSHRYSDAIQGYDALIAGNPTNSILQPMSVSLKAGALFSLGRSTEAALLFSKAFSSSLVNQSSNFISFRWSVRSEIERVKYLQESKTAEEKVALLVLFALSSSDNEMASLQQIYEIDPTHPAVEVIAAREINKWEANYLTHQLNQQKGGSKYYFTWNNEDNAASQGAQQITALADLLYRIAKEKKVTQPGLFLVGAAYARFMVSDFKSAENYLKEMDSQNVSAKVYDQRQLIRVLLLINNTATLDPAAEAALLPALQWLQQKAINENGSISGSYESEQWRKFCRNVMAQLLAKKYHQQGDYHKEVLSIGFADKVLNTYSGYDYNHSINYLQRNLDSRSVAQLFDLMTRTNSSPFEQFLMQFNVVSVSAVIDFAGTAYLRDFNFKQAVHWFDTAKDNAQIVYSADPFIELLYDQEGYPDVKDSTTKRSFAKEMLRLENLTLTDKRNASTYYYKMALGMYNTTYYGHAWPLVAYSRSGYDGYRLPKDASAFEKEYYGCFKAHDYFKKAMELGKDKNFKAACLFMMAKCTQKQIQQPRYDDFPADYDQFRLAENYYWKEFRNNRYFPQLVREYRQTPLFEKELTSCSYLLDFISKK